MLNLPDKVYRYAAYIVLGFLAVVACVTFRHYGISWDEEIQSQYGQAVLDYYLSGLVDQRYNEIFNLYYYGGMFDGVAALFDGQTPFTVYETRHLLNALVGIVGLWGTWKLGRLIGGGFVGVAAMVLLAAAPMYYGHMFNNPKDIPFAVGVVWSLYYMTKTFLAYPRVRWHLMLKLGVVFGLTLGVRVNGIMIMGHWGLILTAVALIAAWPLTFHTFIRTIMRLVRIGVPVFLIAYGVMLICWPWAQEDPLFNPIRAIVEFSNFPQDVDVLLNGATVNSMELPWFYVPLYFYVQLPILQLLLIVAGLFLTPVILQRLNMLGKKAGYILILMTVFFPVGYAMLRHPALYDAVRHFIFILPPLCIAGAMALRKTILSTLERTEIIDNETIRLVVRTALSLVLLGLLALPVGAIMELHPNEYIYVNELEGGVAGAYDHYELDYWGTSFKEAAEQLQAYVAKEGGVPQGKIYKIAICGPWSSAMIYLPPDYDAVEANEPADFFLATTRWMCQNMRPGKDIIEIRRMGVPLSIVKDLRGTESGRLGTPAYQKALEEEKQEELEKEKEGR